MLDYFPYKAYIIETPCKMTWAKLKKMPMPPKIATSQNVQYFKVSRLSLMRLRIELGLASFRLFAMTVFFLNLMSSNSKLYKAVR